METAKKILLVEDDRDIAGLLRLNLQDEGYQIVHEEDGARALAQLEKTDWDAVILDLMLPNVDGLEICRRIRQMTRYLPVIIISARTSETHRVLGLEMGADDYVAKPVQPRVLLARIRALLRRTDKTVEDEVAQRIEFDDLVIDNGGRSVTLNGELVDFTSAEYDLLWLLASNAGRILSREDIFERLRGIEYDGQDRSIDVRISRIRPKIGDDPENPKRIKTVRSKGYLFVKETNGV